MDIRAQLAMVFHLDKCIGCHTCSLACKNLWTDRRGAEYMWWNNVETKPGTGFPTRWEDQSEYRGGWEVGEDGALRLKSTSRARTVGNLYHHPALPTLDDYYEPWTYDYAHLFNAPEGPDQPTARPVSALTGEPIDLEAGPNWDDDLGGSPVYAEHDPNLEGLSPVERRQLFAVERLAFFYFPRICNHCLNPACVAACPSGALHKRGEDGVVLIDQKRCRAWRACVPACPYKKSYFNWSSGKSEKCVLCFPRVETGQAPACFHSCVGRIRYFGVLLYDAERVAETARTPASRLVEAQRSLIADPFAPEVLEAARAAGIDEAVLAAAQRSPVYQYVKVFKLALPPHLEFRTLPVLFYVPPMSAVMGVESARGVTHASQALFHDVDDSRVPLKFLANLLGVGDEAAVRYALRKQKAVRWYRRAKTVGDIEPALAEQMLCEADCSPEEAEAIYQLTALSTFEQRFAIPPAKREEGVARTVDPLQHKQEVGFGFLTRPRRGP